MSTSDGGETIQKSLTLSEAAEVIGVSRRTAHRLLARGELPAYRPHPTANWRVRPNDLEAYMERRKESSVPMRR